jgi:N-acetylmuramic acid 6-phosphate etherase
VDRGPGGRERIVTTEIARVVSPTEERNPRTTDIDSVPVLTLLERINDEDATVAGVVREALPALARLVEVTVDRLGRGGRVHYFGAGSSGRLGLLDAAELPPTYGVAADLFEAHLAGGDAAVRRAQEGSEDDEAQGGDEAGGVGPDDVVIGIAASGYTPYVGGALRQARSAGAATALVTSNPQAPLIDLADTLICLDTGPEVITGSTRMKSATAQKLVLNAFSTAVMVRSGRTWSNLMVDVVPTNAKLRGRVIRLLVQATGLDESTCEQALGEADNEAKTALVVLQAGVSPSRAREALGATAGIVAAALQALGS